MATTFPDVIVVVDDVDGFDEFPTRHVTEEEGYSTIEYTDACCDD